MKHLIAIVVGTRPEVIKMAPLWFSLRESSIFQPLLVSTGQHRQMLDQAFDVFGIIPDIDLGLMQPSQLLAELTSRVISSVSEVIRTEKPSAIMVQGDTTTVLSTAIAAFYENIPVGHVEAGLRTYNIHSPWPEEMNRRLVAPISRWCFAPTEWSAANLRSENIHPDRIHVTGNTIIDSLLWVRSNLERSNQSIHEIVTRCSIPDTFAKTFLEEPMIYPNRKRFVLVTGHRRESFGDGFDGICKAINDLTERHCDLGVLFPVHLNPKVQEPVRRLLGNNPRIGLVPPLGYQDFIWFMDRAVFVLSDSGGIQEEAPTLGKPVLVMRNTTERPEGVEAGTCRLVGTDPMAIVREASLLLSDSSEYTRRSALKNPYGDGRASEKILRVLENEFCR